MLMSANKLHDSRESSITQKTDLDEQQSKDVDANRQNARGYSWWKWRRSAESADKKSPSKDIDDRKDLRQSAERVDEIKEMINDLGNMSIDDSSVTEPNRRDILNESQSTLAHNISTESANAIGKNDDSINSELAEVSKTSFCNEKYRKTLRLTSTQIVSNFCSFVARNEQVITIWNFI